MAPPSAKRLKDKKFYTLMNGFTRRHVESNVDGFEHIILYNHSTLVKYQLHRPSIFTLKYKSFCDFEMLNHQSFENI